jgi:hypothetical protein
MGTAMPPEVDIPEILAEVQAVFDAYEAALTANDIATMDRLFWNAPEVRRFGVGENLYGHAAIAAFRRARQTGPFRRRLINTRITTFGRDFATADTEYLRDGHDRPGRETKTLVRMADGWRIVAAHVSLLGETV